MLLPFAHPTLLAPMEGVTLPCFRHAMGERGGLGAVCTEFVRITDEPFGAEWIARHVAKTPGIPLSVQVMGRSIVRLDEAVRAVAGAGADVIDLNLGCPSRNATKGGVGAALLREPAVLHEVLATMRAATTGLLSAKIRAGFDDASSVVELARTVEAAGANYIVVHPRRRVDHYEGVADWRAIRSVKEAVKIPVIGNGDIWYATDALRMQAETGCDAVMMGRPAVRNPWLFEQVDCLRRGKTPPRPDGKALYDFIVDMGGRYRIEFGPRIAEGRMKEMLTYLARGVADSQELRRTLLRADGLDAVLEASRAFVSLPRAALDLDADGPLRLEKSGRVD